MNGLLILNKPINVTSKQICEKIKNYFDISNIGHIGTLDPMASGVLTIYIGQNSKKITYLQNLNKRYIVEAIMGLSTKTYDMTYKNIFSTQETITNQKHTTTIIKKLQNLNMQLIPNFSAVKYKGSPLYKYARSNIKIKNIYKKYNLYNIKLLNMTKKKMIIDVNCSKGTYIRSIINTIRKNLVYPICTSIIHRIQCGPYIINQAYNINDILKKTTNLYKILINI